MTVYETSRAFARELNSCHFPESRAPMTRPRPACSVWVLPTEPVRIGLDADVELAELDNRGAPPPGGVG